MVLEQVSVAALRTEWGLLVRVFTVCFVLDNTHSNERADEQICRKDMLTTAVVGPGKVRAVTRVRFGRTGLLWRRTNSERSTCVFTRRVDANGFCAKGSMDWRGTTFECSPPPSVAAGFASSREKKCDW